MPMLMPLGDRLRLRKILLAALETGNLGLGRLIYKL